jgi:hypothetical protein
MRALELERSFGVVEIMELKLDQVRKGRHFSRTSELQYSVRPKLFCLSYTMLVLDIVYGYTN